MSKLDTVFEALNLIPIGSELTKHALRNGVKKLDPNMNEATIGFCISRLIKLDLLSFIGKIGNAHRYIRKK